MLSRLNVRTKLLAITLPAALGLCTLAGLGVDTRLDDRDAARFSLDGVAVAGRAARFVHELQAERLSVAAGTVVAGGDQMLETQRRRTDEAAAALREALDGDLVVALIERGDPAVVEHLRAIKAGLEQAERLDDLRPTSPAEVVDAYAGPIAGTIAAIGRLEAATGQEIDAGRRWLAQGIEAESSAAALAPGLVAADLDDETRSDLAGRVVDALERADLFFETYAEYAGPAATERFADARTTDQSTASDSVFAALAAGEAIELPETGWPQLATARADQLVATETATYRSDIATLTAAADAADAAVLYFGLAALGCCIAVLLLAFVVSRGITTNLGRLTAAAREISREQVPALVQSLREPSLEPGRLHFTEVDTSSGDEFAAVGTALNDLGRAMIGVATEQHQSLRKGISDIFVNLARRNQTLLDRQIQFIDRLEENEQDPDQLENLFRLDHLATRMRRNAESLLVLAGAEAPRRRARDVELTDVIRVAVGEVEDFHRVSLVALEEATAVGLAAVDIAHLLAELMENGTQYSPPEWTVDVVGHRGTDGSYVISVTDHGVGMTADRIVDANSLLASPPPVGLALSRSLGFVVAGTLANRHGISVRLAPSASGGIAAEVVLPPSLLVGAVTPITPPAVDDPLGRPPAEGATPVAFLPPPTGDPAGGWTVDGVFVDEQGAHSGPASAPVQPPPYVPPVPAHDWVPDQLPPVPAPSKLVDMLPEGERFDRGLYALLDRPVPPAPPTPGAGPADAFDPAADQFTAPAADAAVGPAVNPALDPVLDPAADPAADPVHWSPPPSSDVIAERSTPGGDAFDLPQRNPGAHSASFVDDSDARTTAPTRSADEVRSVLDRYRSGRGQSPRPTATDGHPDDLPGGPR